MAFKKKQDFNFFSSSFFCSFQSIRREFILNVFLLHFFMVLKRKTRESEQERLTIMLSILDIELYSLRDHFFCCYWLLSNPNDLE